MKLRFMMTSSKNFRFAVDEFGFFFSTRVRLIYPRGVRAGSATLIILELYVSVRKRSLRPLSDKCAPAGMYTPIDSFLSYAVISTGTFHRPVLLEEPVKLRFMTTSSKNFRFAVDTNKMTRCVHV